MTISMLLLVVAIVCWLIAALPVNTGPVNVGWLGLFFYGLSLVIRA